MYNKMKKDIKQLYILLLMLFPLSYLNAQKLVIDSTTYNRWPSLNGANISNDGNYLYFLSHDPIANIDTLCIRSTDLVWKMDFPGASSPQITQDSRRILFRRNDSIFVVSLGTTSIQFVEGCSGNFQIKRDREGNDVLIYRLKNAPGQLLFKKISTGEQKNLSAIDKYWSNVNRYLFVFQTHEKVGDKISYHLKRFDLNEDTLVELGQCDQVGNLVFCTDGPGFAYTTQNAEGEKAIWYCGFEKQRPVKLLDDHSVDLEIGLKIDNLLTLSKNGQLYFTLVKLACRQKTVDPVGVDVWSYKDPKLQSQQLIELRSNNSTKKYKALIEVANHRVLRLESDNEELQNFSLTSLPNNWVILQQSGMGDVGHEWNWNKNARTSIYLLSLKDGSRRLVNKKNRYINNCILSPDEEFLLFYDPLKSNYYSYDIAKNLFRNLTSTIRTDWTTLDRDDEPVAKFHPYQIAGFIKGYEYALIYDQYDIYKVALTGKTTPTNLTQGYGRTHHVVLRLAITDHREFDPSEELILHAFNIDTKDEGFYGISLNKQRKPVYFTMQAAKFDALIKARDANSFLVFRIDAKESPNVFFTHDLIHFNPVSNLHPESAYNWLTTELVTWRSLDGTRCQGILYKPENFDPRKRYPLIMQFYERSSDNLHVFINPNVDNGDINIPLFVSNGYLLFTPDVHYKIGYPGRSAFNSVVAAANLLSKRNYINAKKIGLQGMSFGGFETNYIITHTNMFAAAMSASGMTDFVSIYGSIIGDGYSRQCQYELNRDRMGATLWQIPELYIENSPVLRANAIETPLLMMTNKHDEDVPYQQGIELFTALRRLGKKTWMLQYDGQGHSVMDKPADDFTVRVFQFFNYYLKDTLPPKWMTKGIPASLKGLDNGLELDQSGAKP